MLSVCCMQLKLHPQNDDANEENSISTLKFKYCFVILLHFALLICASLTATREREDLFSTIQRYSYGNCEQQHKVEGCQNGTRPIIAGHPL